MNISEAGNAQILLNWLLGGGQPTQEAVDTRRAQRARQAAQELADRSHRTLQTGWTSTTVAAAWPRLEASPPRCDRGLEFLDSPTREQLLHQLAGETTGPCPLQHPSQGENR
jgi:hypothetical protein